MEALEVVIPVDVAAPKFMGSEVLVGARVCGTDGESDAVSAFPGPKIDDCSSLLSHRDAELCRNSGLLSRSATEDESQGMARGIISGCSTFISGSGEKQIQRKVGKVPRNGSGSFKKLRTLQSENVLLQVEANDTKMESDKPVSHLVKCSNADKSQAVQQKNNVNGRRVDRRNSKALMKAKYDPFSIKASLPSFSPASGGNNVFVIYGLKPEVHDVTKFLDDISLDELLDGTYKCPTLGKDKGKKAANVNENILDSVRKVCSIIGLQGAQQGSQAEEEVDINVNKKIPLSSSPSNASMANGSDGDESSLIAGLSKCGKELESSRTAECPVDKNDSLLYQPRDILEKLMLPPPKDLDSLLQDAVKSAASMKLTDSRSGKPLSNRVSLPSFSWSHNFNGYKSNNDAIRLSNRTCQGRWVRIRSNASFVGGSTEGFVDSGSLTYDESLVPAGQLKYKLPEFERTPSTFNNQNCSQQDSLAVVCPAACLPPPALHSPRVLVAAQTLCDIASHCSKRNSNGILKWPKQPSQKAMKARKSRSNEKTDEEFSTPKSETLPDHAVRTVEHGSSSKKSKISMVERREDFGHIQAVIGLSSVSAPRSNRSSPIRLCRDSASEARHLNNSFVKPSFMAPPPPPPRVMDRNNHNPQKLRKVGPIDWNRTRS